MGLDPAENFGDVAVDEPETALASLEQRVQRLEARVAALQAKSVSDPPQVKVAPAEPNSEPARERDDRRDTSAHLPWLLSDILGEARAMVRMFFDMHYQMAWYTRTMVLILLVMILTSAWWFPLEWIPVIGPYLDKMLDLVLAFLAYKVLNREARRYRDTVP